MKKSRKFGWVLLGLGAYAGLLLLLTAVERTHPDASIRSFSDAIWYSVVTLSTVGYGDLYPVTTVGKLIGVLFVLLSVGALAFLVGWAVSLLTGQLLPRLRLWLLRGKQWYVFSQMNDTALALARSLQAQGGVVLFPMEERPKAPADEAVHFYPGTIASAVAGKKENCAIFFLNEESGSNYAKALSALPLGHPVYCRTEQAPDRCPDNLTLINRYACCARDYWRRQPLASGETNVILVGDGRYARELLEQGLAVNVYGPDRCVCYHVFGDWADFCRCHPQLGLTVAINEDKQDCDSLYFHEEDWNADSALVSDAHRIILCSDDQRENLGILRDLRRYFPVSGSVHLRSQTLVPGETVFGTDEQIFTAENVVASGLTEAARTMHGIYRAEARGAVPAWKELNEFTRQSNLAAADHLLVKIRLLLEDETITRVTADNCERAYRRFAEDPLRDRYRMIEHQRWMRFHSLHNWRYGPVRDNGARCHPMMVPFAALSQAEQAKDDYAWQLLASMAKKLEENLEET